MLRAAGISSLFRSCPIDIVEQRSSSRRTRPIIGTGMPVPNAMKGHDPTHHRRGTIPRKLQHFLLQRPGRRMESIRAWKIWKALTPSVHLAPTLQRLPHATFLYIGSAMYRKRGSSMVSRVVWAGVRPGCRSQEFDVMASRMRLQYPRKPVSS